MLASFAAATTVAGLLLLGACAAPAPTNEDERLACAAAPSLGPAPQPGNSETCVPHVAGPTAIAKPAISQPAAPPAKWPTPETTGVPDENKLKESGPLTVTVPGAVVEGLIITGTLSIRADNVRVRNSKVIGRIDTSNKYSGIQITDVEVDHSGGDSANSEPAIGLGGYTCLRCYVHGVGHGLQMSGDDSGLIDSYVIVTESNDASHKDAVISNGSSRLRIRGSVLTCASEGCTAAVGLFGDFGQIDDVLIEGNLLNTTGGYCIHGGVGVTSKPFPDATNVHIRGNTFGSTYHPQCGMYGAAAYYGTKGTNSFTGNVWQATGVSLT